MISAKIKRNIALWLLIVISYFILNTVDMVTMILITIVPVFIIFTIDDSIAYLKGKREGKNNNVNIVDIALIMLFFGEILNLLFTDKIQVQTMNNSIFAAIIVYFFCRVYVVDERMQNKLICAISIFGFLSAILFILSFLGVYYNVLSAGFNESEIIPLRFLFKPRNTFINIWGAIFLAYLPFNIYTIFCIKKKIKFLAILSLFIVVMAAILTLSRGTLLALFLFVFLFFINIYINKIWTKKEMFIKIGIFIGFICLCAYPFKNSLIAMTNVSEQSSQIKSIEGRIDRWHDCLYLFKQNPVFGIGEGGYPLESMIISNKTNAVYHHREENTMIQILVERGVIGAFPYIFLLVAIFYEIKKKLIVKKKFYLTDNVFLELLFFSSFLILLFREMTFSALFENNIYLYLLFIIIFIMTNGIRDEKNKVKQ